ncbi:MAG TPA: YraN family protein [Candidatus Saccharibacteria bacterium]|nr:YraN family protein [Candidatus Saccharibacteria bacterium]
MSTTSIGRQAEDAAADYLKQNGYKILDQNWRTRWCEIDIVAQKGKIISFVEVKYRKSTDFGGGLEYITPKKQQQMAFAAEFWVSSNKWKGDYNLSAVEVTGLKFEITEFLEGIL